MEHLFDNKDTKSVTNLTIGAPGPETLNKVFELYQKASHHRLCDLHQDSTIFQYGPTFGYSPFLRGLAKFLTQGYNENKEEAFPVNPESLLVTSGATVGLWLSATTFLPPGDQGLVFLECPSYFIAKDILVRDLGHQALPVSMEPDGINVEEFERLVTIEYEKRKDRLPLAEKHKFWAMLYSIPTFHNPTGTVLSEAKSKKLVEIARKFDILIVCDDVYNLLYFQDETSSELRTSPKRLFAFDNPNDPDYKGHVISNGSFSKLLGPGLRLGWLEVPKRCKEPLDKSGVLLSGGALNNVTSAMVLSAIDLGLIQTHISYLRKDYEKKIQVIFSIFDQELPSNFTCNRPLGGYFIWVTGPETGFDSLKFSAWCAENFKVQVLPSVKCGEIEGKVCHNSFRLSFAFYEIDRLREGAINICKALNHFMANK